MVLELLEQEETLGLLIKRCGILMTQIARREFEQQPISFSQWTVLRRLSQCQRISPTTLSEYLDHDIGALTRVVDELVRKGLARRDRSEHDRRAVEIAITPEGHRIARLCGKVAVDLLNRLVEPFSVAEIDRLTRQLKKFLVQLEAEANPTARCTRKRVANDPE